MRERGQVTILESPHTADNKEAYRKWFARWLEDFDKNDKRRLLNCFGYAWDAHRSTVPRNEGVPYIVHPVEACLFLIQFGIRDVNILRAALLHDTIEDSDYIVSRKLPFEERIRKGHAELSRRFNTEVADIVVALTKYKDKDLKDKTKPKQERREILEVLNWDKLTASGNEELSSKIIVTKMGDRYQNLLTLEFISKERQERNLRETEKYLVGLIREHVLQRYPQLKQMFERMVAVLIIGWSRQGIRKDPSEFGFGQPITAK